MNRNSRALRSFSLASPLLLCLAFACTDDTNTSTTDPTTETGDGDGDPTTGDGDGDPTTGDGDGDPTTGDGDGDPTTGDGDGDPTTSGDGDGAPDPVCGDGIVDGDEECDDGNLDDADDCTAACLIASCGDGILNVNGANPEECDDGNAADDDACLATCVNASCGDGYIQMGVEGCDEGPNNSDMGSCLASCQLPSCGDGYIQAGVEDCDGNDPDNAACAMCLAMCNDDYADCNTDILADGCEVQLCGGTCDNPGEASGMLTFDYTGSIQEFIVPPCAENLTIEVWGAQGGENIALINTPQAGLGARMKGEFVVTPGQVLEIVVGQKGINANQGNTANGAGGGGGGSFVWIDGENVPLIVAGGGGGSSLTNNGAPHYYGKPGVITEAGSGSRSHDQFNNAPGGASGADGKSVSASGGNGWNTVMNNPAGNAACNYGGAGGYGGGGGSGCSPNPCNFLHTAGGGGGYSGGGAGGSCYYFGGGGGGSYNAGANQDNEEGVKSGNGQVVISW